MADRSKIEWTDATWTPIRARGPNGKKGWHCEHVSEGCRNCYAEGINRRLGTGLDFKRQNRDAVEVFLSPQALLAPLHWRAPRMVFVCSMTDLFADFVPDEWIDWMFTVMAMAPRHTFQILTKRPARMRAYMNGLGHSDLSPALRSAWRKNAVTDQMHELGAQFTAIPWPLPNVWLGTSAEDQKAFDDRAIDLNNTPAAIRFFSFEPLLGKIDARGPLSTGAFHWAIIGGESGPGARVNWAPNVRAIVRQCAAAGVACFVKQMGANVQDQDDAGFEGCSPTEWELADPFAQVEFNPNGYLEQYQGAPVRVRLRSRKGGDPAEWPADLRVRQMPGARP